MCTPGAAAAGCVDVTLDDEGVVTVEAVAAVEPLANLLW